MVGLGGTRWTVRLSMRRALASASWSRLSARATWVVALWTVLAIHVAAWIPALPVLIDWRQPPMPQSIAAIASGIVAWRVGRLRSRRLRTSVLLAMLAAYVPLTLMLPLPFEYTGRSYMGDGEDNAKTRYKFETNVPWSGTRPAIQFKAHLGDTILAVVDRSFGRNEQSAALAYRFLSGLGGALLAIELAVVLLVFRGAARACRYVALVLACTFTLGYYGYYEVGYMALSAGAFPLLLRGLRASNRKGWFLEASASLQGLHAALHGFGLLGIAGGALGILLTHVKGRMLTLFRYLAHSTAAYVGWFVIYALVLHIAIEPDAHSGRLAIRGLTAAYYFDDRLVHPLVSTMAWSEIGAASLAIGVPLLVFGVLAARSERDRVLALAYAVPGLLFLVLWWPSPGVRADLDLLLAAHCGVAAAAWLASRSTRSAGLALVLLTFAHMAFWSTVANRTLDRIWAQ